MYTKQILSEYPYFKQTLEEHEMSDVIDSLTGLVARPFIIGFVRSLIEAGTPFTFAIMDLDNFKFINDTYGHRVGDGVLMDVAHSLIEYLGNIGIAGRFGGDEFLFVDLQNISYDEKKHFLEGMYFNYRVLRKNVKLDNCNPFITGTVGCATFPYDAKDYDGLFALIDKTLYRGKTKGRNCYIIYVEEKHKSIEIQKLAKEGIYTTFHRMALQFDLLPDTHARLQAAFDSLKDELRIADLFYIGEKLAVRSMKQPGLEEDVYANLYHKKTRVETQEISLLALFACGCRDKLIHVFSDPNFNLVLSFRPVQELFMHYTGNHQDLYGELLEHDCDGYVLRSCIHGIGAEGFEKLCPLVMPYLDSDNMNLVTESIRTLGRLHYGPALEKIRAYTSHETWWIRSAAVTALAGISPDTCFSDLMRCLCDKEWWVRLHAAEALNSLPGHPDLLEEVAALEDRFAYDMMSYIRERGRILEEKVAV